MAVPATRAPRPRGGGAARDGARPRHPQISSQAARPVWVRRLHADGLPTTEDSGRTPLLEGSQRFVDRWSRVATGY